MNPSDASNERRVALNTCPSMWQQKACISQYTALNHRPRSKSCTGLISALLRITRSGSISASAGCFGLTRPQTLVMDRESATCAHEIHIALLVFLAPHPAHHGDRHTDLDCLGLLALDVGTHKLGKGLLQSAHWPGHMSYKAVDRPCPGARRPRVRLRWAVGIHRPRQRSRCPRGNNRARDLRRR